LQGGADRYGDKQTFKIEFVVPFTILALRVI